MFEFFIALFGGSFLGAKLHSEKKQLKEFDKKQAVIKDAYDSGVQAWEASVVDRNLEDELTERLNSDIEFKQAAIQEMQEELGDDIPETLGYPTPRSAVLRYLLAKKGKLLSADASQHDALPILLRNLGFELLRLSLTTAKTRRDGSRK